MTAFADVTIFSATQTPPPPLSLLQAPGAPRVAGDNFAQRHLFRSRRTFHQMRPAPKFNFAGKTKSMFEVLVDSVLRQRAARRRRLLRTPPKKVYIVQRVGGAALSVHRTSAAAVRAYWRRVSAGGERRRLLAIVAAPFGDN